MEADKYHELAMRTKSHDQTPSQRMLNAVLGLCGEAGEIADMLKKHTYHGHALDIDDMIKEAGDLQWYIVQLADSLGVMLSDIMRQNIDKLRRRYPEGFSSAASQAREDANPTGYDQCWRCRGAGTVNGKPCAYCYSIDDPNINIHNSQPIKATTPAPGVYSADQLSTPFEPPEPCGDPNCTVCQPDN